MSSDTFRAESHFRGLIPLHGSPVFLRMHVCCARAADRDADALII